MALSADRNSGNAGQERDPVVDRVYAEGAHELPSENLDAAILAAARREVRAGPGRAETMLRSWRIPVSLAAVIVVSVSVVLLMREEGAGRLDADAPVHAPSAERREAVRPAQAPARTETGPPAVSRFEEPAAAARDAPTPAAVAREDRAAAAASAPGRAEAQPPQPPSAPSPVREPFAASPSAPREQAIEEATPPLADRDLAKKAESGAASTELDRANRQAAPRPPASAASASTAPATGKLAEKSGTDLASRPQADAGVRGAQLGREGGIAAAEARPAWEGLVGQPPEKWLARIEELRRAGRDSQADEVLAEFRKRYPGHPVPSIPGR